MVIHAFFSSIVTGSNNNNKDNGKIKNHVQILQSMGKTKTFSSPQPPRRVARGVFHPSRYFGLQESDTNRTMTISREPSTGRG